MRLQGKVAIVTGAGTGIGQAIAVAFAREGATVMVDYVGEASVAEETMGKIEAAGGKALSVAADISRSEEVQMLMQKLLRRLARLIFLSTMRGLKRSLRLSIIR